MVEWVAALQKIGSEKFKVKKNCIFDNFFFTLHYKITVSVLACCLVLTTCNLALGKPISCFLSSDHQSHKDMFEDHCLMGGTKTIYDSKSIPFKYLPYPGIVPGSGSAEAETKRQPWYKWTGLIFFVLSVAFYIPRYMWKLVEQGRLGALRQEMGYQTILTVEDRNTQRKKAVDWIINTRGRNKSVCLMFFLCEWLNVAISFSTALFLDHIFENQFTDYGFQNFQLLNLRQEVERFDPLDKIFPKVAKCDLKVFGQGGTIITVDGMCFLFLNHLNEPMFVILWFWVCALAAFTSLYLVIYRSSFFFKSIRSSLLHNACGPAKANDINIIAQHLGYCDWFLLRSLCLKMPPFLAYDLITDVAKALSKKKNITKIV